MGEFPQVAGVRFRGIAGFPGYCVGDDGSVWSLRPLNGKGPLMDRWRKLGTTRHCQGYRQVALRRDGRPILFLVHRIVLEAFVGPCPGNSEACHCDGVRDNNRLSNLRWDTRQENVRDVDRLGHRPKGTASPSNRLTEVAVRAIRQMHRSGIGYKRIAKAHSISPATAYDIIKGRTWGHLDDGVQSLPG
jgi:hypothetical protein